RQVGGTGAAEAGVVAQPPATARAGRDLHRAVAEAPAHGFEVDPPVLFHELPQAGTVPQRDGRRQMAGQLWVAAKCPAEHGFVEVVGVEDAPVQLTPEPAK